MGMAHRFGLMARSTWVSGEMGKLKEKVRFTTQMETSLMATSKLTRQMVMEATCIKPVRATTDNGLTICNKVSELRH